MTFPVALADVESLRVHQREGARWRITLAGVPGWCWEFPRGLCLALTIERPAMEEAQLVQATLWLASIPDSLDDSLVLEGEHLFLVRRYDQQTLGHERNGRLQQHLAIVRWFATHDVPATGTPVTSASGSWA